MTEAELKAHLEAADKSPDLIAAALRGLDEATLRNKPAPDKWSIREVLAHLADVEILYGYRMRQILADKAPTIAPIDSEDWARNLGYGEIPAEDSLTMYRVLRRANLRVLRRVTARDLDRGAYHPELDRQFTLAEIVQRIGQHGADHLRQIERLKKEAAS